MIAAVVAGQTETYLFIAQEDGLNFAAGLLRALGKHAAERRGVALFAGASRENKHVFHIFFPFCGPGAAFCFRKKPAMSGGVPSQPASVLTLRSCQARISARRAFICSVT